MAQLFPMGNVLSSSMALLAYVACS